ncbi:DUF4138 domain-containing protein [uncultured Maribacter sp.]|uniref:DUF4138 domain-containing protein n=1 Tax=uncultured Maribacter sp. TaxID=431308 RepID=UPI00261334F0|nr:DUF4138 domain-containing protein [uncultured Maribacter sp.]
MKLICRLLLLFVICTGHAQSDTLYANNSHNVALFFPSPIRQAVSGSENFTFSYNRSIPQNFGLLQASPGPKSNLLVVTHDGQLYSFALHYRKKLSQTNKFIPINASIGHENQTMKVSKPQKVIDSTIVNSQKNASHSRKANHFEDLCSSLLLKNSKNLKSKRKDGLTLTLQNIEYHNREVYLVLDIANKSGIDFELDYLKMFKVNGNPSRKSSYQKLQLVPIYAHNYPIMVKNSKDKRFVYVVSKFTLGDSEKLLFELNEERGSRTLNLKWE